MLYSEVLDLESVMREAVEIHVVRKVRRVLLEFSVPFALLPCFPLGRVENDDSNDAKR